MNRKQLIVGSLLTFTSVVGSCVFIAYGAGVAIGEETPKWIVAFGVITVAYGLCSFVILIMAWLRYGANAKSLIGYLAITFMAVFFLGSLDVEMISSLEVTGIFFVAIMLFINWLAVSMVVKFKNAA